MKYKKHVELKEQQIALLDIADEKIAKLQRINNAIRNGEFESAACAKEGIKVAQYRTFVRGQWSADDFGTKVEDNNDCYCWQETFLRDLFGHTMIKADDFAEAYEWTLSQLGEREQTVIRLRYEQECTLDEISEELGITRERARQILAKTMRKLRHPQRAYVFVYGLQCKNLHDEHALLSSQIQKREKELRKLMVENARMKYQLENDAIPLETQDNNVELHHMDISVRSYNALKRHGITMISQLDGMTMKDLMKVRNLGQNSIREIVAEAEKYGIIIK